MDNEVVRCAWDESCASADGTACGPFFELTRFRQGFGVQAQRAVRIAPRA
ncbi:MAG TPA: hypothetical protein VJ813_06075 [Vicinamibacterales bacterium]|nr:hypothetical protein [Vicinamibacterales bacterium]